MQVPFSFDGPAALLVEWGGAARLGALMAGIADRIVVMKQGRIVEQGSAQPVDAPHHHRVTGLGIGEKFLHSGTLDRILRPGGDIAEDITVLDPGGDQGVVLKCRILTDGGYPGVAQQSHTHHHASLNPSMEEGGTLFGETGW